jgi:hypothetical protein
VWQLAAAYLPCSAEPLANNHPAILGSKEVADGDRAVAETNVHQDGVKNEL